MTAVKRLLIIVAVLAGLALPGTAGAATPCRNKVFNDWYRDGRIASSYPVGCYRDALKHIPTDAKIYSNLSTDIKAAMRAAIRRQHGKVVPKQVGRGFKAAGPGVKGVLVSIGKPRPHDPAPHAVGGGVAGTASGTPLADTASGTPLADTASGPPLPLLILGGVALALVAAGAIGVGMRRVRHRR